MNVRICYFERLSVGSEFFEWSQNVVCKSRISHSSSQSKFLCKVFVNSSNLVSVFSYCVANDLGVLTGG